MSFFVSRAERPRALRHIALTCALGAGLVLSAGHAAWASAGCTALNGTAGALGNSDSAIGTGFIAGDRITLNVVQYGPTGSINILDLTAGSVSLIGPINGGSETYTVPADTTHTFVISANLGPGSAYSWSCAAAATGATDSQKLASLQQSVAPMVATTSGQAISGAISTAIDNAFGSGGAPFSGGPGGFTFNFTDDPGAADETRTAGADDSAFGALAYAADQPDTMPGKMPFKAPPRALPFEREWSLWADVRGTGWQNRDAATGFSGHQINLTAGLGRKLSSDVLIGVVTGYEHFNYDVSALTGSLSGHGATIGGYGGWQIAPTLRFDAALTWSRVNYDASAGTATGAFHGNRWMASSGLTGTYVWRGFILTPSARIFALWERQNAYTDSLGAAQASNAFSAGRISTGGRVAYPWTAGSVALTPYLGLYGDWRFGSNTTSSGNAIIGLSNGWSARITGGVSMRTAFDSTLTLGGEYGGLGADYKIWSRRRPAQLALLTPAQTIHSAKSPNPVRSPSGVPFQPARGNPAAERTAKPRARARL